MSTYIKPIEIEEFITLQNLRQLDSPVRHSEEYCERYNYLYAKAKKAGVQKHLMNDSH